jgi:integrase
MRGHISRRGAGWQITIDQGKDPVTGQRRRISRTTRTKGEAQDLARELTGNARPATNAFTVGQLLDAWWKHLESQDLSPATMKGYQSKVEMYVRPALGHLPLRQLTAARIDELYRTMRTTKGRRGWKLSVSTVRRTHAVISRACAQAVRWGWIPTNPADNASPGSATRHEIEPPSIDEVRRILAAATVDNFDDIVQLALATGARRGELAGLQWKDIDLKAATLTIRRSVADQKGGTIIVEQRRKSRTRTLTIDPATVAMVKARRKRIAAKALVVGATIKPTSYVLAEPPDLDSPLRPQVITGRWRDAAGRVGSKARFHDLRHFHVTQLLAAGIPVRQVAARVGHASGAAMTLNVYAHAVEALDQQAAVAIARAIDG